MAYTPTDVAQEALDLIGWPRMITDIEDGSEESRVLLRQYVQIRRQLIRAAPWDFARKRAPMLMLADSTGQTPNVGSLVAGPFTYEYAYPDDCLKARFVPWNNVPVGTGVPASNIAIPAVPLTTGSDDQPPGMLRIVPAKFVISTDVNYPPAPGQLWWEVSGLSPTGRVVVLTNVNQAEMVYTYDVLYPSMWDPLFRAAMASLLGASVCMKLWASKGKENFGLQMLNSAEQSTRSKVIQARLTSANEGVSSSDIVTDWMQTRRVQGSGGNWWGCGGGGPSSGPMGGGYSSWDALSLPSGTVF